MVQFTVLTLFPQMFESPLGHSILKRAQEKGLVSIRLVDLRDYATDRHRTVDDYPYGGGQGMVMKPGPLVSAIEDLRGKSTGAKIVLLSPAGKLFTQAEAARLAETGEIVLICGRYEGVDERVKEFVDEEISVGDYTLSGGEPAAVVIIDAVARLVPGVLGNPDSPAEESFCDGLLEYPQYTRPEEFRHARVPDILLSGDHERVRQWRREMSLRLTRERRPDLFAKAPLAPEEKRSMRAPVAPVCVALLHHPVLDKNGQIVTTSVTNMDIHDIARAGRTYGVARFYVATPVKPLQKLAQKILEHWEEGYGSRYNSTRKEALALVDVCDDLEAVILDIERRWGRKPLIVATSARSGANRTSFAELRDVLIDNAYPILILFGTGWGLSDDVLTRADYILEAIHGPTDYNHLSVRSAAAIILDRLLRA